MIATLALFIALGGVGYAAVKLPKNSGEPAFEAGCADSAPVFEQVGFYEDNDGIVHLTGSFQSCGASVGVVFQLPPGFRPAHYAHFSGYDMNEPNQSVRINPAQGNVEFFNMTTGGLEGDTFRAAG